MKRHVVTVLVALAAGVAFGLVVARSGSALDASELTDLRLWLVGAALLAAFATGPVTGALTGLAAMAGVLGTLEVVAIRVGSPPGFDASDVDELVRPLLGNTDWLDPTLLIGAAVAGAAIGTVRLALRAGRRLLLLAAAVAVLAVAILGTPQLSDLPFAPRDDTTVIR